MANHRKDDKSQLGPHHSSANEDSQLTKHQHDRFLTKEELINLVGDEVLTAIDAESIAMAHERHLERIGRTTAALTSTVRIPTASFTNLGVVEPGPFFKKPFNNVREIVASASFPRINHRKLTQTQRDRFNNALRQAHVSLAIGLPSPYIQLAAIHADTAHRMHSMDGGTQRFLPWHRKYLLECEKLLRRYEPSVRIPYWDYANDHERPDWVWSPPEVRRRTPGEGFGASLPNQATMNEILANSTYTGFTFALESDAHDKVHNWCNGTITAPPTAAQDPIFWLLHANVDRIWNIWQETHNGVPHFFNEGDAVLDPWEGTTAADVDSVLSLGYWYRKDWH